MKELKAVVNPQVVDEVLKELWNPVKELKVNFRRPAPPRTAPRWNPVKELKGFLQILYGRSAFHVESGEGIERVRGYLGHLTLFL